MREERARKLREGNEEFKKVHLKKPLYVEKEERYVKDVVLPELEQQQRELRSIRASKRPFNKSEIDLHAVKYEEQRSLLEHKLKTQREKHAPPAEKSVVSKYTALVLQDDLAQKEERARSIEEKRRLKGLKNNYARFVREMYWPQVSNRKRIEVELRKDGPLNPLQPRSRVENPERASVDFENGTGGWLSPAREGAQQRGSP